jgi:hypothetical protein
VAAQRAKRPQHTRGTAYDSGWPQGHGATSTHENKIARLCPTYVDPSTEYARTLRHLQASDARWRAEKNRAQSYTLGTQGVGGSAGGAQALWRFGGVPPPQPRLRESGGDTPT